MANKKIKVSNGTMNVAVIVLLITFGLPLSRYSQAEEIKSLIQQLKSEDASVREEAVKVLREIKDGSVVAPLIALLKDEKSNNRRFAVQALGLARDVHAVEPLIAALKDKNRSVRIKAVKALAIMKDSRAVKALIGILKEEDWYLRFNAAESLGKIGETYAVEPLCAALKDENPTVRGQVAKALGEIEDIRAIEPLIEALKDEKRNVRRNAAVALTNIKDELSVKPLIAALKDEDLDIVADAYPFFMSKIEQETEIVLAKAINKYGTVEMAKAFRNSGNRCLEKAAEEWTKKEFLQTLQRKILLAIKNVAEAKKEAARKRMRDIKKAKEEVKDLRIKMNRYMGKLKTGIVHLGGRTVNMKEVNPGTIRYKQKLAEAEQKLQMLSSRHRIELQEFKDVEKKAVENKKLFLQAKRSLDASTDKPKFLKAEMIKWEKAVEESVKDIDAALRMLEEKHRLETEKERKKYESQKPVMRGRVRRDSAGSISGSHRRR